MMTRRLPKATVQSQQANVAVLRGIGGAEGESYEGQSDPPARVVMSPEHDGRGKGRGSSNFVTTLCAVKLTVQAGKVRK